uniref:G-protein coupled receptors family 1 profile domain-containing protein n=1 Tax=Panagrolaimus sp. JU765 TaxID=591449 RepID=A0AC34PWD7_9BILA
MRTAAADLASTVAEIQAQTDGFPIFAALKGTALALLVLWTIAANTLVFIVLYKNPRLQTVPNLLVGNLAFSDLCLGLIVLPLSSVYAIAGEWLFPETLCVIFVSADILCSTASIWNLSIVGLDRYWAITSPVAYMSKRNKKTAGIMILLVWASSAVISLSPLLGWKQVAEHGNLVQINGTWQCTFLDLPSYTIYSATGSFFIPIIVMFFVYFKIYQAFAKHRARQIYRQKVIRKHIESTILHEISHVLPTSDEFAKEEEDEEDSSGSSSEEKNDDSSGRQINGVIIEEDDEVQGDELEPVVLAEMETQETNVVCDNLQQTTTTITSNSVIIRRDINQDENGDIGKTKKTKINFEKCVAFQPGHQDDKQNPPMISYEKVKRHKQRKERMYRKSLQKKPKAISAAKERRGVKVLGIILGCFTICWAPFFIMYVVVQFCSDCNINPHIEMFITWLGYSNSAMNPIIYTVFNRDYQIALKRLFTNSPEKHTLPFRPTM